MQGCSGWGGCRASMLSGGVQRLWRLLGLGNADCVGLAGFRIWTVQL
jgi:hypothetical protein